MQREESPVMATELERIAAKARCEPELRFTSLAHHVTRDRVEKNLKKIPNRSAPGCDGVTVAEAKRDFDQWIEPMLQSVHQQGYKAPPIRRVYIPPSPVSRRSALWACPVSVTGHSSAVRRRYCLPFTSRIFYLAPLVDARGVVPTMRYRPSMS